MTVLSLHRSEKKQSRDERRDNHDGASLAADCLTPEERATTAKERPNKADASVMGKRLNISEDYQKCMTEKPPSRHSRVTIQSRRLRPYDTCISTHPLPLAMYSVSITNLGQPSVWGVL